MRSIFFTGQPLHPDPCHQNDISGQCPVLEQRTDQSKHAYAWVWRAMRVLCALCGSVLVWVCVYGGCLVNSETYTLWHLTYIVSSPPPTALHVVAAGADYSHLLSFSLTFKQLYWLEKHCINIAKASMYTIHRETSLLDTIIRSDTPLPRGIDSTRRGVQTLLNWYQGT